MHVDEGTQNMDGAISPAYLTACVRDLPADTGALILTESVTNFQTVAKHLRVNEPGSYLGSAAPS